MKNLRKSYTIDAPQQKVYEALIMADHIEMWTGDEAEMDISEGGKFSLWSGSIHGINIEVTADRIVQDWKEENWKAFSKVEILLTGNGNKTTVELIHDGIPDDSFEGINEGWDEYYMIPLKEYCELE